MPNINWKTVWEKLLKDPNVFPLKQTSGNSISVSCPTRFSKVGKFSIEISPTFSDNSINFELLLFNDNVTINDLTDIKVNKKSDFNSLSSSLTKWENSNKLQDRFEIKSDGFTSESEAINTLVDYINNKATESGRMFDDKLDELNDSQVKKESYRKLLRSIKENRKFIFKKIECILNKNYNWKPSKNESYNDSVASFYDKNNNLVAVVTLSGSELIIDLSKDLTSKISVMQSDSDIEDEITKDIEDANNILANQEIAQLDEVVAANNQNNLDSDLSDNYNANKYSLAYDESRYLDRLFQRVVKLESLYIKLKHHKHY